MAPSTAYDSTKAQPPSVPANNRPVSPAPPAGKQAPSDNTTFSGMDRDTTPVAGGNLDLPDTRGITTIRPRVQMPDTSSLVTGS